MSSNHITQTGYNKLVEEMMQIKNVERPNILVDLNAARANGDLKENADYHAAREKLQQLDDRLNQIEARLSSGVVLNIDTTGAESVLFGATVTVKNIKTQKDIVYSLVSQDEVDPMNGKISSTSPIGKALIGAKKGQIVSVQTPKGLLELEVVDYQ